MGTAQDKPSGPDLAQGIPLAAFEVSDIATEFDRLRAKGVAFVRQPGQAGPVMIAVTSASSLTPLPAA